MVTFYKRIILFKRIMKKHSNIYSINNCVGVQRDTK